MSKKNDKRDRLIGAANELIYQQTFNSTTLADIASKADVPLGNVYYYFKTKDDILKAVISTRESELLTLFGSWAQIPDPKARLQAFIQHSIQEGETIARFGCALGSLCQELGKQNNELGQLGTHLMHKTIEWVETQFKALGKGEQSQMLTEYLIASIQGVSLITLTFKEPKFLERQAKTLEQWLEAA